MAGIIQYVIYQDKKKGGTGKYYGRAVQSTTIDTEALAERIQANCTLKKSDVQACLVELAEVLKEELQNGNRVKLDNFGIFWISIKSTGADTAEEYSSTENVTGFRVRFLPQGSKDTASGKITRDFLEGLKCQKATGYRS